MHDIDHGKTINDWFEHSAGDDVPRLVASTLAGQARSSNRVARRGGEEFIATWTVTDSARQLGDGTRHQETHRPGLLSGAVMLPSTHPSSLPPLRPARRADGVSVYFALACMITWVLAIPATQAWTRHEAPSPSAVACAGLSAFGPLIAALLVAGPQRRLREVFGRWRTHPGWIVVGLVMPLAIHLVATASFVLVGGQPDGWLHPPLGPEQVAAMIVFPLGEEFGWRGFAHPRMVARYGPVRGSLLLGAVWGLWHLMYSITPEAAGFDAVTFGMGMIELPLYSVIIAWLFERSNRSMAVAIACHAGAHLDHFERASRADLRLQTLHLVVVAIVASLAAKSLAARSLAARTTRAANGQDADPMDAEHIEGSA